MNNSEPITILNSLIATLVALAVLLASISTHNRVALIGVMLLGILFGYLASRSGSGRMPGGFALERGPTQTLVSDGETKADHPLEAKLLTVLPGRDEINKTLQIFLEQCQTDPKRKFSVLLINVSRFRTINESLGHATGDRVIREVAKRLEQSRSDIDFAGHLGGDEFVLILARVEDPDVASTIAQALKKRISASIRFQKREVYVQVNVGIAVGSSEYMRAEDILRDTDLALSEAKTTRSNTAVFQRSMRKRAVKRQQIETDLRYAIVCDELEVHYQPIVRLHDAALCGAEALVRWNHPTLGKLAPAEFIPIAESSGLIKPLTINVLKAACAQLNEWNLMRADNPPLMVSVNLSVTHFGDPDLVGQIKNAIEESAIIPGYLKLEITEGAVMEDSEKAIETLHRIKDLGVSISIDDFGTGYSSLSYLHKFPIDYLKIDRSFVAAMENSNENLQIVKTIITLATALKLSVIAEGIETNAQWEMLNDLGCQFGQGYLFARPMPSADMDMLIAMDEPISNYFPRFARAPSPDTVILEPNSEISIYS